MNCVMRKIGNAPINEIDKISVGMSDKTAFVRRRFGTAEVQFMNKEMVKRHSMEIIRTGK